MNPHEHAIPDDFESNLRGLQPSPVAIDVTEMFYRAGLEAGARRRPSFGKAELIRTLSVALLIGIVVGSLAYRAGLTSVANSKSTELAITSLRDESIETSAHSTRSLADIDTDSRVDRLTKSMREDARSPREQASSLAVFPDRLSDSFTSNLPASVDLYRLPRRSTSRFQSREMLTVRSADTIETLLGDLQ